VYIFHHPQGMEVGINGFSDLNVITKLIEVVVSSEYLINVIKTFYCQEKIDLIL